MKEKAQRNEIPEQHFTVPCDCARKGHVKLGHYDIVRCSGCGCEFWALQLKRNGPLVIVPYPGDWRRAAHAAERRAA